MWFYGLDVVNRKILSYNENSLKLVIFVIIVF